MAKEELDDLIITPKDTGLDDLIISSEGANQMPARPAPEEGLLKFVPDKKKALNSEVGDVWTRGIAGAVDIVGNIAGFIEHYDKELIKLFSRQTPLVGGPATDIGIEQKLKTSPKDYKIISKKMNEASEGIRKEAAPATGIYSGSPEEWTEYFTDPKRIYSAFAEGVPQMGVFAVASMIHPALGFSTMVAAEGGEAVSAMDEYEEETGEQIPPLYRNVAPLIVGGINGALERVGLEKVLRGAKITGNLRRRLTDVAISMAVEPTTEGAQEVVQIANEVGFKGDFNTFSEMIEEFGEELIKQQERIGKSIYQGLVVGTGVSTGSNIVGGAKQKIKEVVDEKQAEKATQEPEATPEPEKTEPATKETAKEDRPSEELSGAQKVESKVAQELLNIDPNDKNRQEVRLETLAKFDDKERQAGLDEVTKKLDELKKEKKVEEVQLRADLAFAKDALNQSLTEAPADQQDISIRTEVQRRRSSAGKAAGVDLKFVQPKEFSETLERAINKRKEDKVQVDLVSEKEAKKIVADGGKLVLAENGEFGGYVKADGYIGGIFKDPDFAGKGVAKDLLDVLRKNGGTHFDAFGVNQETGEGTALEKIYLRAGFVPVARMKFNPEFAPEGFEKTTLKGQPDIVFFSYDPEAASNTKPGEAGKFITDYDEGVRLAREARKSPEKPPDVLFQKSTSPEAPVFMDAAEERAFNRVKGKVDPSKLEDYAIIGAAKIARGADTLEKYTEAMVGEFGEKIRPFAADIKKKSDVHFKRFADKLKIPTLERALKLFHSGEGAMNWYDATGDELIRIFGEDAELFAKIVAATSVNATPATNVTKAIQEYTNIKTGRPNSESMDAIIQNLNRIRRGEDIQGPKIGPFSKAIMGDVNAVVIDTWMWRIFGKGMESETEIKMVKNKKTGKMEPASAGGTDNQRQFMIEFVNDMAKELGVTPVQVQAAMWFGVKEQVQGVIDGTAGTIESYLQDAFPEVGGIKVTDKKSFRKAIELFEYSKDELETNLKIIDAAARTWAKKTGNTPDDYYRTRFHSITTSEVLTPRALAQEKAPVFYSKAQKIIDEKMPNAMDAASFINFLKKHGVKDEEIEWSGLDQLAGRITKEDALQKIEEDGVRVDEVLKGHDQEISKSEWAEIVKDVDNHGLAEVANGRFTIHSEEIGYTVDSDLGPRELDDMEDVRAYIDAQLSDPYSEGNTKFGDYTVPGPQEGYRELLLTLPLEGQFTAADEARFKELQHKADGGIDELREFRRLKAKRNKQTDIFKSSHFDEPNILAHVRFNERIVDGGFKKVDDSGNKLIKYAEDSWKIVDSSGRNAKAFINDELAQKAIEKGFYDTISQGSIPIGSYEVPGKRMLFVEEIQSDWHQAGRKRGFVKKSDDVNRLKEKEQSLRRKEGELFREWQSKYGTPEDINLFLRDNPKAREEWKAVQAVSREIEAVRDEIHRSPGGVPDAPFKNAWHNLALKRIFRYAAENGFDRIGWTTGEQQAERYDLSKQVDEITVSNKPEEKVNIGAGLHFTDAPSKRIFIYTKDDQSIQLEVDGNGKVTAGPKEFKGSTLDNVVGKEMAEKIMAVEGTERQRFSGADLRVGGRGMKAFYDQMIPAAVNKMVKRYGAKAGEGTLFSENFTFQWLRVGEKGIRVRNTTTDEDGVLYGNIAEVSKALGQEAAVQIEEEIIRGNSAGIVKADELTKTHSIDIPDKMRQDLMVEGMPLFQTKNGAVEFTADGRAIIHALKGKNISTLMHEFGHIIRREMTADESEAILKAIDPRSQKRWDRRTEEHFARAFEKYLRTGKAPNAELESTFAKFKQWLSDLYKTIKGSEIDVSLPKVVRDYFDSVLDVEAAKPGDKVRLSPLTKKTEALFQEGGKERLSRVFEKVKASFLSDDKVRYETVNIDEDLDKAIDYVKKNPDKARGIALGLFPNDSGVLDNHIATVMEQLAVENKNFDQAARIASRRSLELTRAGQEIASERGKVTENSTGPFVRRLLEARRQQKDVTLKDLDTAVKEARKKVREQVKKITRAQSILDKIAC